MIAKQAWGMRFNFFWNYYRLDNNIFSLVSTLYLLNDLKHHFSNSQNNFFSTFKSHIQSLFQQYANVKGRPTYNFYSTTPLNFFPNGFIMNRFKHFKLPDDIDDTALIIMSKDYSQSDIKMLKKHLNDHAFICNGAAIYNTWFGKHMPPDADIVALCNLMILILDSEVELEQIDENTINYLAESIDNIKKSSFWLSRHYGHPAIILYHYARLMSKHKIEALENRKTYLIQLAYSMWNNLQNDGFKLMVEIALFKWGENIKSALNSYTFENNKYFYSFIGAPLAPYKFLKPLASKIPFLIFYKSKLHELALELEHFYLCKASNYSQS